MIVQAAVLGVIVVERNYKVVIVSEKKESVLFTAKILSTQKIITVLMVLFSMMTGCAVNVMPESKSESEVETSGTFSIAFLQPSEYHNIIGKMPEKYEFLSTEKMIFGLYSSI